MFDSWKCKLIKESYIKDGTTFSDTYGAVADRNAKYFYIFLFLYYFIYIFDILVTLYYVL